MPKVSIIIPCYNHGKYILDAIKSVEAIPADKNLYEMIIINDGSTDEYTNQVLAELAQKGYHVIFQSNQGLSASRNNAIKISKGDYILPLDADNKIRSEYLYKGIEILDANQEISIVYGNCQYFGDQTGIFKPGVFNLQKMMVSNFIDACAMYRKQVWTDTGGYDLFMNALSDWEIWLHAAFKGFKFQYADDVLYDYRVLANSMIKTFNNQKTNNDSNIEYLIKKHNTYFGPQYIDADLIMKFSKSPSGFIGKIVLKKYFPALFQKLVMNGKLRKYI